MSGEIVLTKLAFEDLLKNLVDLEEGYKEIINEFYPNHSVERIYFIELLTEYIKELNGALKQVSFEEKSKNCFPFVIIGNKVEITDIDNGQTYKYHIVGPGERNIENDCISFLSPVGKSLLLREKGETISVGTPPGVYRYRIKSIFLL